MGKLIIPGNGTQPPVVRTIDEIVELDARGNELSRRPFYGTMILTKVDGRQQLARHLKSIRPEPTWYKTACMVMFGIWISQLFHTFR